MNIIKIKSDFIKLDQFLKLANIVSSGGEAKVLISNGEIKVNNEVVFQRGKKLKKDDIIEFDNKSMIIK